MARLQAKIDVTIKNASDFKPLVPGTAYAPTHAALSMHPAEQHGVSVGPDPHHPRQQRITVNNNVEVDLVFHLKSGDGTDTYYPVGLSMKNEGSIDPKQRGLFPIVIIDRNGHAPTLTLTDADNDPTDDTNYEFFIVLQRACDGEMGVIDPRIQNN